MTRRAIVPAELRTHPFTLEQARRAGLERWNLQGASWRSLGAGVYAWAGLPQTPWLVLASIQLRMPSEAAFSGRTAAWVHGLEVPPLEPVEVTVPEGSGLTPTRSPSVRRALLPDEDVVVQKGLRLTTVERTLADLAPRLTLVEAVVLVEAALRLRRTTMRQLLGWAARHPGRKGIKALRRVLELAQPGAESPMETRLRLALVLAGLPAPVPQAELRDEAGRLLGRVDLYYPSSRLAIEYDGASHRETLAEDNRRQNALVTAGYRLLRFTAADVLSTPEITVARVRAALRPVQKPRSQANVA